MKDTKDMTLEEKIEYYELQLKEKEAMQRLQARESEFNRARSHTVGSLPGGAVELSLRGIDGKVLWTMLQPVEVSELIHTLASSIGCYAALKPREDFTAYRNWTLSQQERTRLFLDPQSMHEIMTMGRLGVENNNNGVDINNKSTEIGLTKEED
jgi:hypothetical protein